MRVGRSTDLRRHERIEYPKPYHGVTVGEEFDGMIRNISAGGAAVSTGLVDIRLSNYDFVEMHIQSMDKKIPAQVVRSYEGGFAVKFEVDERERANIQAEIDQFQRSDSADSGS